MKQIFYYGGSFDPFHKGHEGFIKRLIDYDPHKEIWVIPSQNWLKPEGLFSIQERINMAELVLKSYPQVKVLSWSLTEDTSSTFEVAKKIKSLGYDPIIALGEDNLKNIHLWKNSQDLILNFNFILLTRKNYNLINNPPSELSQSLVNKSIKLNYGSTVSATEIREGKYQDLVSSIILPLIVKKLNNKVDF